jgi:hypothetical protein
MTMKIERRGFSVKEPVLSQPQFCEVAGIDMRTANNWVARKVVTPSEIGGRQIKGTRLFSVTKAFQGRLIGELVNYHRTPPSDAAKIAEKVTEAGWIRHWTDAFERGVPGISSFMLVAWVNGRVGYQQIAGDPSTGFPDFSSVKRDDVDCFFKHPFIILPLSRLYREVYEKCREILARDSRSDA